MNSRILTAKFNLSILIVGASALWAGAQDPVATPAVEATTTTTTTTTEVEPAAPAPAPVTTTTTTTTATSSLITAPPPTKETALEGATASQVELVRRQERLIEAKHWIQDAKKLQDAGDFPAALDMYQKADILVADAPASSVEREQIRTGMSVCLFEVAKIAYANNESAKALAMAEQAYKLDPSNEAAFALAEKAASGAQREEVKRAAKEKEIASQPPEISNADFKDKQKRVLELYRVAENYFKSEQFDQAETALKEVLRIDPYSATAYHRLREVQLAKYKKLNTARQQTESETMLDVQRGWQLPLRRDRTLIESNNSQGDDLGTSGGKKDILHKLNSIVIKKIEFENTPILSAINYLITESREADLPAKQGVNIIPAFDKGSNAISEAGLPAMAPALPGDPVMPGDGLPPPISTGGAGGKVVTLNLRNVPLLTAIKYLTTVTDLKYRIEPDAVVLVSGTELTTKTQTRTFNVAPGIFRSVIERAESGGGGGGGGGFIGLKADSTKTKSADVKKAFEDFGISFPEKTSISYNEGLGILIATHTNDVLDQIEQIILRLNKTPPQVQIEAKFIDVRQTDLEELGFRWAFAPTTQNEYTVESGAGVSLPGIPVGGPYRGVGFPLTDGNRNAGVLNASALDTLLAGSGISGIGAGKLANTLLTVTGVLTNPQVQLMIDALSQKGLTNLLSAPRVTTTSGESAKILVTREFIYPSAYTDPQVSTGGSGSGGSGGGVGIVAPSPSAFSTREIGVILDVKPQVGADNYTISLTLSPEVVDFEGFVNYQTFAVANSTQFTFILQQPIFNKRTLTTSVTIWDGQTVLLGGLIREDTTKVNDKIPILGDIPLLGRFFQSKVENTTKRNLMMFLTSRIVDPAGNPVRRFDETRVTPPTVSE